VGGYSRASMGAVGAMLHGQLKGQGIEDIVVLFCDIIGQRGFS